MRSDDPEVTALLEANAAPVEALRRLTRLAELLLSRATLTEAEAQDARHELETTRASIEQLETMLTLRRQRMRPM